jgi:serine/threonine protein kinase
MEYASIEHLKLEETAPYFDMWSLGISIFQLMTHKFPFDVSTQARLLDSIRASES